MMDSARFEMTETERVAVYELLNAMTLLLEIGMIWTMRV